VSLRDALTASAGALLRAPGAARAAMAQGLVALKAGGGEGWAEPDPNLPRIERTAIDELLALWRQLGTATLGQLELTGALEGASAFRFSAVEHLVALTLNGEAFVRAAGAAEGPLVQQAFAAWVRGVANASAEIGDAATDVVASVRQAYRDSLRVRGLELVRDGTVRTYREAIVDRLVSGEFDGKNPRDVARALSRQFDAGEYNWERLARSEIAMAQVDGKRAEYEAAGITRVDYVNANDGKVSTICRGLAAGGPYALAKAPVPVRDSHPECRCTWRPVLDEE
jgi:SPP1 gp7 family putative phage head morphogenesis protein